MEFRLIYRGWLPPAGQETRSDTKHAIRRQLHPQLKRLWEIHPNLQGFAVESCMKARHPNGFSVPEKERVAVGINAIADNWCRNGFRFVPLVMEHYALSCNLDILFMREGASGCLVAGGDLDNRIKTLFDGLKLPKNASELGGATPQDGEDPMFVLLADDLLISEVKVTSDRLLTLNEQGFNNKSDAYLLIHVRLQPTLRRGMNWVFE